ncbi:hypothetical protein [Streptomyces sp. H39-S7]|uniref:hypothetical protein n=1 Tax=Streptomyces sp. H39-S7 TaxID=3004357 RepID=UPI0022AEE62C|nr:hypothetical protein [Streptomyces sp. H39-S7]MCZ4122131.1 hypothetical protein [Streptomyces sp. H39-S7]
MWDGFTGVLPYVAISAFLCFLVPSVPVWLGRRKIRAVAAGRAIRIRSRLRVDEPARSTSERGELVALPGGPLYFMPPEGPVLELPPGGTFERTLYARAGSVPGSGRRVVRTALVHRTPSGGSLRVETARGDSRALPAALQAPAGGRPAPRALPARLPVWCAVLAVLALLGAVPVASIAVFGERVTAHVTSNTGDDYCGVGWADPWDGSRRDAEVDCIRADERQYRRGDSLDVIALPRPLRGNAFDTDSLPILGALCAAGLLVSALGFALGHIRWSRHWRPSEAVPAAATTPDRPEQPSGDPVLSLARPLDRLLARRLHLAPDFHDSPWWRVSVLRKLAIRDGVSFGGLTLLGLALVLLHDLWTHDSDATLWIALTALTALGAAARVVHRAVDAARVVRTLLRAVRSGDPQEVRHALLYVAEAVDTGCLCPENAENRHAEVAVATASFGIGIPGAAVPRARTGADAGRPGPGEAGAAHPQRAEATHSQRVEAAYAQRAEATHAERADAGYAEEGSSAYPEGGSSAGQELGQRAQERQL